MLTLFTKPSCPQCSQTKAMLTHASIAYIEVDISQSPAALRRVMDLGYRSAPVVITPEGDSWAGFRRDKLSDYIASNAASVWV